LAEEEGKIFPNSKDSRIFYQRKRKKKEEKKKKGGKRTMT